MAQSSEQINVYVRSDADMEEVKQVVADLLVDDQENEDELFFIRVRLGTVTEAVQRINELGYSTDEDV